MKNHPHYPPKVVSDVYHWLKAGLRLNETERLAAKRIAASAVGAVPDSERVSHRAWERKAKRIIARLQFDEPIELPCPDEQKRRDLCLRLIIWGVAHGRGVKHPARIEAELDHAIYLERLAA